MKNLINHRTAKKTPCIFEEKADRMWSHAILSFNIHGFPMLENTCFLLCLGKKTSYFWACPVIKLQNGHNAVIGVFLRVLLWNLLMMHTSLYNSWKPRWWFRWPKGHTAFPLHN
ncbi:MAG: hypothetical protein R6U85_04350 [Salinivirgaceae bacterium]